MAHTITNTHIEFGGSYSGYPGPLTLKRSTLYTTNLMYYNWNTGELASLFIYCGPKGGHSCQFSNGSRKPFFYSDIDTFTTAGSTVIFRAENLQKFLPAFIKATTEQISIHSRLLTKHQTRLAALQSLTETHPEAFI